MRHPIHQNFREYGPVYGTVSGKSKLNTEYYI